MRIIWKAWLFPTQKKRASIDDLSWLHHHQFSEWEWMDQRLTAHFEQDDNGDHQVIRPRDKTPGKELNKNFTSTKSG